MVKLNLEPLEALRAAYILLGEAHSEDTEKQRAIRHARMKTLDAIMALGGSDE